MAKTETPKTEKPEIEATPEVEALPGEGLGIYIEASDGEVLGHGYESAEAAQAHIDAHLEGIACSIKQ